MKKPILTFGLIAGIIASALMCATVPFLGDLEHSSKALALGYICIVLAFVPVYLGIRSYRDTLAGGTISFGRGFTLGLGITLICCVFYVVTWEVLYFHFIHGVMDGYFAKLIQEAQAGPGTAAAIQAKVAAVRHSQQLYENPLVNALYTFVEPFPVGLLITLISAAILRKKPRI